MQEMAIEQRIYRWLGHEEVVKDFKPKNHRNNNITPSQLLTPDIVKLTNHMPTEKIRVLVSTLACIKRVSAAEKCTLVKQDWRVTDA